MLNLDVTPLLTCGLLHRTFRNDFQYRQNSKLVQLMPETSNRKLRTAAIGVGSLGRHHARNYAELAREGRIDFVGVCDTDPAAAENISKEHQSPAFADWRELLNKVDAVSIATPTETHCDIALAFLAKGIHVL